MREIKFRAWDKKEKRYWTQEEMNAIGGYYYTFALSDDDGLFVLEQFTGLQDKNGKEIYEGDIVEGVSISTGPFRGVVEFESGTFGVAGHVLGIPLTKEVIGNIHENSNLLN